MMFSTTTGVLMFTAIRKRLRAERETCSCHQDLHMGPLHSSVKHLKSAWNKHLISSSKAIIFSWSQEWKTSSFFFLSTSIFLFLSTPILSSWRQSAWTWAQYLIEAFTFSCFNSPQRSRSSQQLSSFEMESVSSNISYWRLLACRTDM